MDLAKIREPQTPRVDSAGTRENEEWDIYQLYEQQHNFKMRLNRLLFHLAKFSIAIIWGCLTVLTLIWFYHIAAPTRAHFLVQNELQTIERILFSSALISVGGKYFSKFKLLDATDRPNHHR